MDSQGVEIANLAAVKERLALADRHETMALRLADHMDGDSIARAAHHFVIADGLRGRARFAR